jgi:small GTP-binding protein
LSKEKMKVKLCLVGDRAVGKTSLVKRYLTDNFSEEYRQTMGAKVYKKVVDLSLELREKTLELDMTLWDIMGDMSLAELTDEAHFRGVQGLLVVCDMTRRSTVESLGDWMSNAPERVKKLPMYILVNKNDLVEQVEIVEDDVIKLGDVFSSPILMTSAKTGSNVQSAFEYLAKSMVEDQSEVDVDFLVEKKLGNFERPVTVSAKPF